MGQSDETADRDAGARTDDDAVETAAARAVVDVSEADEEALRERVAEQQAEIERLQDKLLDLSARIADGGGAGVCPEPGCKGAVVKTRRWFRPTVLKCQSCGEVVHEY
jgi:hypothetical protein